MLRSRYVLIGVRAATIALGLSVVACGGLDVRQTDFSRGKILILPTRDVVQGGVPHDESKDTGSKTDEHLTAFLVARGWEVVPGADSEPTHQTIVEAPAAAEAGRTAGADLVLQVVLGEFLNAVQSPFRSDFVTLEGATLVAASSGEEVWSLEEPVKYTKRNTGDHFPLLEELSEEIADSISEASGS